MADRFQNPTLDLWWTERNARAHHPDFVHPSTFQFLIHRVVQIESCLVKKAVHRLLEAGWQQVAQVFFGHIEQQRFL